MAPDIARVGTLAIPGNRVEEYLVARNRVAPARRDQVLDG
jgi:hypothetical protein